VGGSSWAVADFDAYKMATSQDALSLWMKLEPGKISDKSKGADPALLPKPVQ
jgi:hypothetical protein